MTYFPRFSIVIWVATMLIACSDAQSPASMQAAAPQGIPVDVAKVVTQRLTDWDSFTGRLQAPQSVSVRPRVSGYIDFVAFEEGAWVEQGETLFLIDNRAFKAEVDRLTAELQDANSKLNLAEQDYKRASRLQSTKSVSEEVVDARKAAVDQAKANVAATQASLELARLNRGYARVEAPISGRVSRANITAGNYVTAGQTALTTIVSTRQLHAYFDIDESTYLNYVHAQQASKAAVSEQPVAMRLANEQEFDHWGHIDFVDNQVNANTGTIRVRAVFDNPEGTLLPGLFAHLKLAGGQSHDSILIDEKAIGTDLNNKYVLVMTDDNKIAYRAVQLGDKLGALRVIKAGLIGDETIVVSGLQRVRPGAVIAPNEVPMSDDATLTRLQQWQQRAEQYSELASNEPDATNAGI